MNNLTATAAFLAEGILGIGEDKFVLMSKLGEHKFSGSMRLLTQRRLQAMRAFLSLRGD